MRIRVPNERKRKKKRIKTKRLKCFIIIQVIMYIKTNTVFINIMQNFILW
jgi:hypothetical protein